MIIPQSIDVRQNFEKARELLGFSKRAIARQAKMSAGSLDGVLKHNNPKVSQILKLSKGLGVSVRYLVGGGDPELELKASYVFDELKRPTLRPGWKPEVPNVAARIEIILKRTGQTKRATANRVCAIQSWWSSLLKKNNPTARIIERIAYALGVKPVDLVISVSYEEFGKIMIPSTSYQ